MFHLLTEVKTIRNKYIENCRISTLQWNLMKMGLPGEENCVVRVWNEINIL